jgi:hypothetical protein
VGGLKVKGKSGLRASALQMLSCGRCGRTLSRERHP